MDLVLVLLAHDDRTALAEAVDNARSFCPDARLVLYNSGDDPGLGAGLGLTHFPAPRRYRYAGIAGFFLDVFEWLAETGDPFDAVVNLETDLLFIRPGFEAFVDAQLASADYLAPNLVRRRRLDTDWRPMRSLRPEFEDWFQLFGFRHLHGTFSPAQVFSRRYVETLLADPRYPELRRLVAANRSYTLQEVLYPTLTEALGLRLAGYPEAHRTSNRYRPYQAVSGVRRALAIPDAYFVHPVRRTPGDPARRLIGELTAAAAPAVSPARAPAGTPHPAAAAAGR